MGTVALEFYGGIKLLKWAGMPLFANLSLGLLFAFICGAFTVSGGLRGIARADIFMDCVTLSATCIIGFYLINSPLPPVGTPAAVTTPPASGFDVAFVVGMALIFLPFQVCVLDSWQRCSAWTKAGQSPKKWLIPGAVLLVLAYSVPIFVGAQLRAAGTPVPPDSHPLLAYLQAVGIPKVLIGIVFAGFICAIFSTADELLNCCSLSFLFDFLSIPLSDTSRTDAQESRLANSGRFYTGAAAALAAVIGAACIHFERKISDLAVGLFSAQVAFMIPLLIAVFRPLAAPRFSLAAISAVLAALATAVITVVAGWIKHDKDLTDMAPIFSLIAAVAFFAIPAASKLLQERKP